MKTLLVLSPHPELAGTIRAGTQAAEYRVVHRATLDEAEALLAHGLAGACIVDAELTGVQGVWMIEKLRRRDPRCPVIVYTGAKQPEWEEEAYLQGVSHVLTKPVRMRVLNSILERLLKAPAAAPAPAPPPAILEMQKPAEPSAFTGVSSLNILRDFSSILTHSLDAEALLRQFLLQLRELMSINRAAIFLRADDAGPEPGRRLRAVSAIGISPGLLEHFELSFEAGIGGQLLKLGRILRRNSEEARLDIEVQKEFEILGAQVAVPVFDRETLLGVAVFDGRVTGEPLVNAELGVIFHLLEQVGLAIRNIRLHDQLAANNDMMSSVLRELGSACVVVSRDLKILHANKMARRYFGQAGKQSGELEFPDLPQVLAAKIYQVLRTGSAIAAFRFEPENPPGTVYNVTAVPFHRENSAVPASALLMVEDLTQSEQLRKLEVEAANLRLIRTMADRLAHEVGNAMVPLSTHQQLLAEKFSDPDFRKSLDVAMAEGVKRVTRLINQMRFLARDSAISGDAFLLNPLIEEAYAEARRHQPGRNAQLKYEHGDKPVMVTGDRAALKHALTEVMINALQANPDEPRIGVSLQPATGPGGVDALQIEVKDNGTGFTPEAAQKASAPFYTTRNVGLGLGLAVSRKIIETHHGRLEIVPPRLGGAGIVRISLPVTAAAN